MTEDPAEYGVEPVESKTKRSGGKNPARQFATGMDSFDCQALYADLGKAAALLEVWRARTGVCLGLEELPRGEPRGVADLLLRAEFILQSQIQLARLADGGRMLSASVLFGLGAVLEEVDTLVLQALEVCGDSDRGRKGPAGPEA